MLYLFLITAAVGGTFLILQLLMLIVGLGGDHGDGHDWGGGHHDFDHGGDHAGAETSAGAGLSTWAFQLLSVRTMAAAFTFFGLSGWAALDANLDRSLALLIAVASGMGAFFIVALLMRGFRRLQADGTLRIHRAVGQIGTVYLRIPANKTGAGKITVEVQERTVTLLAQTAGDELPSYSRAQVIGIISSDTVEVAPVPAHESSLLPTTGGEVI